MSEVRFQVDENYLDAIREALGTPNAKPTELVRDSLTILRWAAEERSKGRYILSTKQDGSDVVRLVMPSLEAAAPKPERAA